MECALKDRRCVDVIIPVFNGRESIDKALISVFDQTGDFINRIIVIDDGSQDDTAQIIQNLDNNLILLVRTSNQGVAKARNLAVEKSTSEWIAFLDADDVWMPDKLEKQINIAHNHNVGFVCSSVNTDPILNSGPLSPKFLARGNVVATSSVLVKRSVLKQISPVFSPKMTFAEDYFAWLKCVSITPSYFISNKLVDYVLSERPRYRWGQILSNIFVLNISYAIFLRKIGISWNQRIYMICIVFLGSLRSVISIIKRFIFSSPTRKHQQ